MSVFGIKLPVVLNLMDRKLVRLHSAQLERPLAALIVVVNIRSIYRTIN
jgi:hypothetical protein